MGYYLPETASGQPDLTAKNRVWGFFGESVSVCLETRRSVLEPHQENYAGSQKPASGIPLWPSRDPIEELGGLNLYRFCYNNSQKWVDVLGRDPSFWDQWSFGPKGSGAGCANEDKVETSLFEKRFPTDVAEWKKWAEKTVTEAFSCENRGRSVGSRGDYEYTLLGKLPDREVTPWPQSTWSMIAELGSAYLTIRPSAIKGRKNALRYFGICCDSYEWSATLELRDGLGWDVTDGWVYNVIGDGNPLFSISAGLSTCPIGSPFPDRDIKRAEWKIYGTGTCCSFDITTP